MAYFGTDGIRGRVGGPLIRPSVFFLIGVATARYLLSILPRSILPSLCIGRDTRASGSHLVQAFLRGFTKVCAIMPVNLGICPSPVVAWMTAKEGYDLGVVVTASHNPAHDNGIKFFLKGGVKATDEEESIWSTYIESCLSDADLSGDANALSPYLWPDMPEKYYAVYAAFCDTHYPLSSLRSQRVVIDCAHGAFVPWLKYHCSGDIALRLCHAEPDGMNINDHSGALFPQRLYAYVQEHQADYGFALDGDGDRVILVDAYGRIWDGDYLMLCLAHYKQQMATLKGIVGTVMTNLSVEHYIRRYFSVPFTRSAVGDKYVSAQMRLVGANLGAESSGHIISSDDHVSGDGFVSLLLFMRACQTCPTLWPMLKNRLQLFPSHHMTIPLPEINAWSPTPAFEACLADCRAILGRKGRVVVRASGTEPVLRVLVEAELPTLVTECQAHLQSFFMTEES